MSSARNRLLFTFLLSVLGVAMSCWWYFRMGPQDEFDSANKDPIAYLRSYKKEVQRKPGSRLLWQVIDKGTPLYPGDSVKTPPLGEGELELITAGTVLKLEPDSLIVLEANDGNAALNLVSGSLFVKQQQSGSGGGGKGAANAPVIRAGKTQLVLGDKAAELNLSISENKEANIAVSKGEVSLSSGKEKISVAEGQAGKLTDTGLDTSAVLEVLAPGPLLELSDDDATRKIKWKPLSADFDVVLEQGGSRADLKPTGQKATGKAGTLETTFPLGTTYWRLVATSSKSNKRLESIAYRVDVLKTNPPALYAPKPEEEIFLRNGEANVLLSWEKQEGTIAYKVDVASDDKFKNIAFSRVFADQSDFNLYLKKIGTFYWRVTPKWERSQKYGKGTRSVFHVKKIAPAMPPQLAMPANHEKIRTPQPVDVALSWEEARGAASYILKVAKVGPEKGAATDYPTTDLEWTLPKLEPGRYQWRVQSLNADGQKSKWSESRGFEVILQDMGKWHLPVTDKHEFSTQKPSIIVAWEKAPKVKEWQFRFAPQGKDLATANWRKTKGIQAKLELSQEGPYAFEVQGLNGKGDVEVLLPPRVITVTPIPALPPPQVQGLSDKPLKAEGNGSLAIQWQAVKDAKEYFLAFKNAKTGAVIDHNTKDTSFSWKDLLPGNYELQLATINERDVKGAMSQVIKIVVPNKSDISAPKAVKIKVH